MDVFYQCADTICSKPGNSRDKLRPGWGICESAWLWSCPLIKFTPLHWASCSAEQQPEENPSSVSPELDQYLPLTVKIANVQWNIVELRIQRKISGKPANHHECLSCQGPNWKNGKQGVTWVELFEAWTPLGKCSFWVSAKSNRPLRNYRR